MNWYPTPELHKDSTLVLASQKLNGKLCVGRTIFLNFEQPVYSIRLLGKTLNGYITEWTFSNKGKEITQLQPPWTNNNFDVMINSKEAFSEIRAIFIPSLRDLSECYFELVASQ